MKSLCISHVSVFSTLFFCFFHFFFFFFLGQLDWNLIFYSTTPHSRFVSLALFGKQNLLVLLFISTEEEV